MGSYTPHFRVSENFKTKKVRILDRQTGEFIEVSGKEIYRLVEAITAEATAFQDTEGYLRCNYCGIFKYIKIHSAELDYVVGTCCHYCGQGRLEYSKEEPE